MQHRHTRDCSGIGKICGQEFEQILNADADAERWDLFPIDLLRWLLIRVLT